MTPSTAAEILHESPNTTASITTNTTIITTQQNETHNHHQHQTCPETVDKAALEQALRARETWAVDWKGVDVLDVDGAGVDDDSTARQEKCSLRVFFLESLGPGRTSTETGDAAVKPAILRLLRDRAGLSDLLITAVCGLGHWYTVKHGYFVGRDGQGRARSFDMVYEYAPGASACTHVSTSLETGSSTYFCLNFPPSAVPRLTPHDLRVPFKMDVVAADETLSLWQHEMVAIRGRMKRFEANEPHEAVDSMIRELHRLSRSWHILFRKVSEFEVHLDFLQRVRSKYASLAEDGRMQNTSQFQPFEESDESLAFLVSSCRSLRHLVSDYRDRTATQINLLFHLANQAESRDNKEIAAQNKEIAELTARIAQQTQRDSASMITIAAVTMFFLPGTFVASLLSTVVFNFDGTDISVSRMWWILPATAIPLTIFVFAIWLWWLRRRLSHDQQAIVITDSVKQP
ncbi:hypothetical protein AYL99_04114 [Fonsecaea erecta]|uniref:Uncharacterized protein n=1 Tax=Fonsecaea erecta TaxID=1367422 RepID=A0A178ZR25_9EURO|nr:hypothetical protein AYL99_04114 [Fonsecaea erecta]OAP61911.1 hypothetical protein AYL99_04114 [Fonsecaea erecta]